MEELEQELDERLGPFVFEDLEQAKFRLLGSVVFYKGEPMWVDDVMAGRNGDNIPRVTISHPVSGDTSRKFITSPHFNRFRPPPLGFLNYFEGGVTSCSYCTRLPIRRSLQGLSSDNFSAVPVRPNVDAGPSLSRAIKSPSFVEMTQGIYPTVDEAFEAAKIGASVAFHRKYALRVNTDNGAMALVRQDRVVGIARPKLSSLYLFKTNECYMEELKSIIPNVEFWD
jgi:hypothetical protein